MELKLRCRECGNTKTYHLDQFLGRYVICSQCKAQLDYLFYKKQESEDIGQKKKREQPKKLSPEKGNS